MELTSYLHRFWEIPRIRVGIIQRQAINLDRAMLAKEWNGARANNLEGSNRNSLGNF